MKSTKQEIQQNFIDFTFQKTIEHTVDQIERLDVSAFQPPNVTRHLEA